MHSRRNFISGFGSGAAIAMFAEPFAAHASPSASPKALNSVHTSYARILLGHFRKLQSNPKHDIFASGELSTAYRMHCDALQRQVTTAH